MQPTTTPAAKRCQTIEELEAATGFKLLDIFPILAGGAAPNLDVARKISPAIGVSVPSLIKNVTRLRAGVLELFSNSAGINKGLAWKALIGKPSLGRRSAQKLAAVTGVDAAFWLAGDAKNNDYIRIVQESTSAGKKQAIKNEN